MYNMLIADDEEIERKALKMMLENSIPELYIAEAENGIELLREIKEKQYDIVLVDVEMPGLNGLEAIQIASTELKNIKVIVYTAYSNFDYAQMAVKCHVNDYILKPAKRERLIGLITKCIHDIEKERRESLNNAQLKDIIREIRPMMEEELMNFLCFGNGNADKFSLYWNALEFDCEGGCIIVFEISQKKKTDCSPKETLEQLAAIREALRRLQDNIRDIIDKVILKTERREIICFFPFANDRNEYQRRVYMIHLADVLIRKMQADDTLSITAGIGSGCTDMGKVYLSYRESIWALHHTKTKMAVRHYNDLFAQKPKENIMEHERQALLQSIQEGNRNELQKVIDTIFFSFRGKSDETVDQWIMQTLLECGNKLNGYMLQGQKELMNIGEFFSAWRRMDGIEERKKWLLDNCLNITQLLDIGKENSRTSVTDHALQYVKDHYYEDISLEDTARECNVSIYYLSRLFKEQTGENYSVYLTRVRMEAAKELIRSYDCSVKEIAEKTGFRNAGYFCKVFKNYTGYTVSEYKALP